MGSLSGDRDRKKREKEDGILCLKENHNLSHNFFATILVLYCRMWVIEKNNMPMCK